MTLELTRRLDVDIFPMRSTDITEVARISAASGFEVTRSEWYDLLENLMCDSFVARIQTSVVGFMACCRNEERRLASLDKVSVTPELRRCQIGTQMIHHLYMHLQPFRQLDTVLCLVAETNLSGQLFLKENNFWCTGTMPSTEWADCEMAYVMHRPLR